MDGRREPHNSGPTAGEQSAPTAGRRATTAGKSGPTAGEKSAPTAGKKEHSPLQARTNKEERLRQTDGKDPRSGRVAAKRRSRDVTSIQGQGQGCRRRTSSSASDTRSCQGLSKRIDERSTETAQTVQRRSAVQSLAKWWPQSRPSDLMM